MGKEVIKDLCDLQKSCIVPKNLRNNFGSYNYRNIEQISQEIKKRYKSENPVVITLDRKLITEPSFSITKKDIKYDSSGNIVSETIIEYKGRDYIQSTATIMDSGTVIQASAIMRVPYEKKGMDDSQITAATTSFADKYAMGGLLLVSDGIDNDAISEEENTNTEEDKKLLNKKMTDKKMNNEQKVNFFVACTKNGMTVKEILENFDKLYESFMKK